MGARRKGGEEAPTEVGPVRFRARAYTAGTVVLRDGVSLPIVGGVVEAREPHHVVELRTRHGYEEIG